MASAKYEQELNFAIREILSLTYFCHTNYERNKTLESLYSIYYNILGRHFARKEKIMKSSTIRTRIIAILCAMILAASCVAMSACSSNNEDDTANTSSTRSTTSTTSGLSVDDLVIPADGDVVNTETIQNEDGSVTINETLSDGTVISTTTAEDGSIVQTQTHTDGSVTRVETDAQGNQTVTQTPATSTPQETASSSTNNGGGNNGGSTTTTPTTSSSTTPTQPSNPTTSTPATPSTPTTSTPSTTPSTPSQSTPDPEPTPEPTPEPDPEPVRQRTIDPQYICDQVNARMGEVGMIDAVTEGMNAGLTRQESLDEIHTYMGWYTGTCSLYENNNEWHINDQLSFLKMQHDQYGRPSAWIEIQCYLDASYNEVSSIDDAEYVRFIIYC